MKKHIIDPLKLAETFRIKLHLKVVQEGSHEYYGQYIFKLKSSPKDKMSGLLVFSDDLPRDIALNEEALNGLQSEIHFDGITKVKYIPEFRLVQLEAHTKTCFSILRIYWRGQYDLWTNVPKKYYKGSFWDKEKNQLPEVKPH